ncbi:rag1-activating protein 1 [Holotrichia oblita]|uniref:Rag1-activating protein 1 n=1 Tax=Holotrichia oblita TaxID=644536 RepID=A0ACB9T153_HOLOL|nr:rag1-activating protein 1 [Holotrichia oblita]
MRAVITTEESMYTDSLRGILATTASISTLLQFLSGLIICKGIVRKRGTGDMSPFPFISGHLSTSLWLRYGMLIDDFSLIFVNTIGSLLFLGYTVVFYYYSIKRSMIVKQFTGCMLLLMIAIIYSAWSEDEVTVRKRIGTLCCVITVIFFAAPLTTVIHVLKTKSTDSLPFPIILTGFIVTSQWYAYGVLLNDEFIQIPNFLGTVLTFSQLCLFCIYASKSQDVENV